VSGALQHGSASRRPRWRWFIVSSAASGPARYRGCHWLAMAAIPLGGVQSKATHPFDPLHGAVVGDGSVGAGIAAGVVDRARARNSLCAIALLIRRRLPSCRRSDVSGAEWSSTPSEWDRPNAPVRRARSPRAWAIAQRAKK